MNKVVIIIHDVSIRGRTNDTHKAAEEKFSTDNVICFIENLYGKVAKNKEN